MACSHVQPKPMPRWPLLEEQVRRNEAELVNRLAKRTVKLTDDAILRFKKVPKHFKPNFAHLSNCTVCENDRLWWRSVREALLEVNPGSLQILLDEAPLSSWSSVVLELEKPTKHRAAFSMNTFTSTAIPLRASRMKYHPGTGLPGTILYEDGKFRAWLDQFTQAYFESVDGVHFYKQGRLRWARVDPQKASAGRKYNFAATKLSGDPVAQSTFTVMRDDGAQPEERYKSAFNCLRSGVNTLGHNPRKAHPNASGDGFWESTCLAYSADGLKWIPYELQHEEGRGPRALRMASDTSNSLFFDAKKEVHRLINRWNVPLPNGTYGTPRNNPNWWREIRGVRMSANPNFHKDGKFRAWREKAKWYFDREGKTEHLRRQVYSLQVSPVPRSGMFIGLLNVIEWGKISEPKAEGPFKQDVLRTYLATSRDGIHFDTSWVYEQQELIPHGRCRPKPGCSTVKEVEQHLTDLLTDCGWREYALLCCPFDHAQVIPASSLITTRGSHIIYYEGRYYPHERRFDPQPTGLGAAVWREGRIGGVRSDPRLPLGGSDDSPVARVEGQCGQIVSKPIAHLALRAAAYPHANGDAHVELDVRTIGTRSFVLAELVFGCLPGQHHETLNVKNSVPIRGDLQTTVVQWRSVDTLVKAAELAFEKKQSLRLRLHLCGDAKVFSFAIEPGLSTSQVAVRLVANRWNPSFSAPAVAARPAFSAPVLAVSPDVISKQRTVNGSLRPFYELAAEEEAEDAKWTFLEQQLDMQQVLIKEDACVSDPSTLVLLLGAVLEENAKTF